MAFGKKSGELKNLSAMRNTAFAFLALIMAQFWLGMTINLEIALPVKHLDAFSTFSFYAGFSWYIAGHIVIGLILLLLSLMFLSISLRVESRAIKITAAISVASVIGAIMNGIMFLMSGQFFGWSVGMAMSALSAVVSIAVGLYYIGLQIAIASPAE